MYFVWQTQRNKVHSFIRDLRLGSVCSVPSSTLEQSLVILGQLPSPLREVTSEARFKFNCIVLDQPVVVKTGLVFRFLTITSSNWFDFFSSPQQIAHMRSNCSSNKSGYDYCFRTEMWNEWPKRENRLIPCKIRHSPSLPSQNKGWRKRRESVFPCMVSTGFHV